MKVKELIKLLEQWAPKAYAEDYDNVGLLTGHPDAEITGVLCSLDCIEAVVEEAINKKCNVIVAHHPILFKGLKKITGSNYVERTIVKAIKNDICIYAIHTNLDSISDGVNAVIGKKLGIVDARILKPRSGTLLKLSVYVPHQEMVQVEKALFTAGAGHIGNYSECSFVHTGSGSYKANNDANPAIGQKNIRHTEAETKVEVVVPSHLLGQVTNAMKEAHPYEEVAYDVFQMVNTNHRIGSGMIGYLEQPISEVQFLEKIKAAFGCKVLRHTQLLGKPIQKVAVCGGSGSFLLKDAIAAGAQVFVTADFKYHEFFDADNQIVIIDTGHFENEQFTSVLIRDYIERGIKNIATFAVHLSGVDTNPVKYF